MFADVEFVYDGKTLTLYDKRGNNYAQGEAPGTIDNAILAYEGHTGMIVRFFGGSDFDARDAQNRLPAVIGYSKGVPMGGDLKDAPKDKAPTFLVAALKDPIGANLDRYQIVKGWIDKTGKLQEKIYDVAWSGERKPDPKSGKLPPVGSTVDVANATWTNTIGAPELIAVWKDPEFDARQPAFYYARVLEIPTPRWTAYDAKRFGVKPLPGTTMTLQERAYTSPIWYTRRLPRKSDGKWEGCQCASTAGIDPGGSIWSAVHWQLALAEPGPAR
jgi:hypothetical protein